MEIPDTQTPGPAAPAKPTAAGPGRFAAQGGGLLLFLPIPLVLFLFVRHPEPVGLSLLAGVVLMLGHRFVARPWMERVRLAKCLWCNRFLPADAPGTERLEIATSGGPLVARCCAGHHDPAARYLAFLDAWSWPLRLGIFLPLLLLLGSLAAFALRGGGFVPTTTALFKLVIGATVNLAAFGYLAASPHPRPRVPFPPHNFFLLGIRNLLWIFRLVGIWWIIQGVRFFLA